MDHEQLLTELRKDNEYLRKKVDAIDEDVREIRDSFLKYRGAIGGALFVAGCFGSAITLVIQYFVK